MESPLTDLHQCLFDSRLVSVSDQISLVREVSLPRFLVHALKSMAISIAPQRKGLGPSQ